MKKWITGFVCVVFMMAAATGCSKATETDTDTTPEQTQPTEKEETSISGTITMTGSTSMEKFASAINEAFMIKYPEVKAQVQFTGSGAGIEAVTTGTVDIGNSSRILTEEEKANGIIENIVAIDGIGVVTNVSNTVTNLTTDQLTQIYTGEVKNWSEIGGSDQPIVVIGREAGSGTRGAFEELLEVEDKCNYAQEIDSTGAVMAKVAATPGAIGYVSVDVIDDSVIPLTIDGVKPTAQEIKSGAYKLSRPFVMATKGEISEQNEVVKALFEFIHSPEGQDIISQVGLISAQS